MKATLTARRRMWRAAQAGPVAAPPCPKDESEAVRHPLSYWHYMYTDSGAPLGS